MPTRPNPWRNGAAAAAQAHLRPLAPSPAGEAQEAPPTPLSRNSLKRNKTEK